MENKKLQLPSGKEVEIVEYVEAGVILDLAKVKVEDQTDFILKQLVVSLDGSTENVYDRIRKLKLPDYKALDKELLKLMGDEKESLKV